MCSDCTKDTKPFTKEQYEQIVARLEKRDMGVITKWRKGLKHIRVGDIVLREDKNVQK